MGSRLLVDGDGGGKSFDALHVRLFHLSQELPRVGGQAFDVPPLSFRENGVERERRFAAARQTREHGERVAGNAHVDVFQVVFLCAFDDDFIHILLVLRKIFLLSVFSHLLPHVRFAPHAARAAAPKSAFVKSLPAAFMLFPAAPPCAFWLLVRRFYRGSRSPVRSRAGRSPPSSALSASRFRRGCL